MILDVETVETSTSVVEIAKTMAKEEIGSVVVTQNEDAVGIICERDMLDKVIAVDARPDELTAEDIMEEPLTTVEPGENLLDAIRLMVQNNIGHLPVVENGSLAGILTVQDVLKATPEILETLPAREERKGATKELSGEGVCEICGEVRSSLVEYNGKWICRECQDFLTG
ncbi:hypothetical protein AKJ65_02170 [candidate division MSBL1 archaeon SCGC-AAA259E19]|uniref:Inosine-5-monophosphate dehydrogenase n=1 Tax=candidate division MSBL1 archaeon SCGC-AAA259E19 TaxID=1698264 RepID=A0A133UM45_9EURY|nr:hypothetical protein AKJ65_02170 [candidate division MSBL1 archaeon SCGC-AAA259E19]